MGSIICCITNVPGKSDQSDPQSVSFRNPSGRKDLGFVAENQSEVPVQSEYCGLNTIKNVPSIYLRGRVSDLDIQDFSNSLPSEERSQSIANDDQRGDSFARKRNRIEKSNLNRSLSFNIRETESLQVQCREKSHGLRIVRVRSTPAIAAQSEISLKTARDDEAFTPGYHLGDILRRNSENESGGREKLKKAFVLEGNDELTVGRSEQEAFEKLHRDDNEIPGMMEEKKDKRRRHELEEGNERAAADTTGNAIDGCTLSKHKASTDNAYTGGLLPAKRRKPKGKRRHKSGNPGSSHRERKSMDKRGTEQGRPLGGFRRIAGNVDPKELPPLHKSCGYPPRFQEYSPGLRHGGLWRQLGRQNPSLDDEPFLKK